MIYNRQLSKSLSWLLRHGAIKEGFAVDEGGYLDVDEILKHKTFSKYTVDDIKEVVRCNDKQRYHIRKNDLSGKLQIRANQGHSFEVPKLELTPIVSSTQVAHVIHGTYLKHLATIKKEGLSKMTRNHIHFTFGVPSDKSVLSGVRKDVEVLIYINLEKALKDEFKFFMSSNHVILSPGNDKGIIPQEYFEKIEIL